MDGDQKPKLGDHIICLPGQDSPEKFIFKYATKLYNDDDDPFWSDRLVCNQGWTRPWFRYNFKKDNDSIEQALDQLGKEGKTTKGVSREKHKKVFKDHENFIRFLFKHWVASPSNRNELELFYNNLWKLFKKVAEFHGINSKDWPNKFTAKKAEEI